jgi:hypothetical protein
MLVAKPNRVTRTYTQHLVAPPQRVFPTLCPVVEAEWLDGWDPSLVLSESGVAEPDCVFTTPAENGDAIWFVTRHEPENGFVEMIKITPGVTACRLSIQLSPTPTGSDAQVTYSHTSLGPEGDVFVAAFGEAYYADFMRDWERRLNHFLNTGEMLSGMEG